MKIGKKILFIALAFVALSTLNSQFSIAFAQGTTLLITNVALPKGTVGIAYKAKLGATNGQAPYSWSLTTNSASLPFGLSLNTNGLISGTPTTRQTNNFNVQVMDANSAMTNKALSIIINPRPGIYPPTLTNGQCYITVTNACGQPITLQYSTNLINWINILTTNLPCGIVPLAVPYCAGFWRIAEFCPAFTVSPNELIYTDPADGSIVPSQSITISNASPDCVLNCIILNTVSWLSLGNLPSPLNPGATASVSVSVSDSALNQNTTYQGAILISDHDNPPNLVSVPVTLVIQGPQPIPVVYPSNITVSASGYCPQSITISNAGPPGSILYYQVSMSNSIQAPFISIDGLSSIPGETGHLGSQQSTTVAFNVASQFAYNVNDTTVSANVYAPNTSGAQNFPVQINIRNPVFTISPPSLTFADAADGVSTVPSQNIVISNSAQNCDYLFYVLSNSTPGIAFDTNPSTQEALGYIYPGQTASIPVYVTDASQYAGATYQGTITIFDQTGPSNFVFVTSLPTTLTIANARLLHTSFPLSNGSQQSFLLSLDACGGFNEFDLPTNASSPFSQDAPVSDICSDSMGNVISGSADANFTYQYNTNSFSASGSANSSGEASGQSGLSFSFKVSHLTRFHASGSGSPSPTGVGPSSGAGFDSVGTSSGPPMVISSFSTNGLLTTNSFHFVGGGAVAGDAAGNGNGQASFQVSFQLLSGPGL